jgi:very-short-patch-repair endonuclease
LGRPCERPRPERYENTRLSGKSCLIILERRWDKKCVERFSFTFFKNYFILEVACSPGQVEQRWLKTTKRWGGAGNTIPRLTQRFDRVNAYTTSKTIWLERGGGMKTPDPARQEFRRAQKYIRYFRIHKRPYPNKHFNPPDPKKARLIGFADKMRSHPTPAERLLNKRLHQKDIPYHFNPQYVLEGYILDFFCKRPRLAVEVDGPTHDIPSQRQYDARRTSTLQQRNVIILRFSNEQVYNDIESVVTAIKSQVLKMTEDTNASK